MVTGMKQETVEMLFNPQNTNEKPAENSKLLLVFTHTHKTTDPYFIQFQKNKVHDPKTHTGWLFLQYLQNTKKIILFFFQKTAINIKLSLLYSCDKTKKIVWPASEGGEEQNQSS